MQRLRGKTIERPTTERRVYESMRVSGGFIRLAHPPTDEDTFAGSLFGSRASNRSFLSTQDRREEGDDDVKQLAAPLDRVGVHVPKLSYAGMVKSMNETKLTEMQERKRELFSKILAKALHRESLRSRRLLSCKTDNERKKLKRKYKRERLQTEKEIRDLMESMDIEERGAAAEVGGDGSHAVEHPKRNETDDDGPSLDVHEADTSALDAPELEETLEEKGDGDVVNAS